jgi:hypothetical protein
LFLSEQSNIAQVNKKCSSAPIVPAADSHAVVVAGVRRIQTLVAGIEFGSDVIVNGKTTNTSATGTLDFAQALWRKILDNCKHRKQLAENRSGINARKWRWWATWVGC